MIKQKIQDLVQNFSKSEIPKPEAKETFRIKGMGTRRGEAALIYTIPSHTRDKPYEKGITLSEFEKAYKQLQETGSLTRSWFNETLPECAKEGSCNFTSIGGVFQMLALVNYTERGRYDAVNRS
ncbi:MAG: hypothetical protein O7D86_04545 [Proteobacteria bacterium]|nr:hypothetical protein [Pseudomonadota bacterium]